MNKVIYRHENIKYWFDPFGLTWVLIDESTGERKSVGSRRQLELFYPELKFIKEDASNTQV